MEASLPIENIINKKINAYNRWGIVVSSGLMAVTLIVSWILFLLVYRTSIDEILVFLNQVINDQGIKFNLTFQMLTIIVLGFAAVTLAVITIPLIFLKKQGVITLVLTLIMLVVAITLLAGSGLLVGYGYNAFYNYVISENITDLLFFILPWGLELVYCLVLIGFCLWLIIAKMVSKVKQEDTNQQMLSTDVVSTPVGQMLPESNIISSEQIPNNFDKIEVQKPQGINIVITNNTAFPQTKLTDNPVTSNTNNTNQIQNNNTITKTINGEKIWTPQEVEELWNKGEIIANYNPQLYREDYAGALMFRTSFINNVRLNDDPKSYNWTIVYQKPLSHGGTTDISNLQPMNNTNAITKASNYPRWKTAITFDGKQNVLKQKSWKDRK